MQFSCKSLAILTVLGASVANAQLVPFFNKPAQHQRPPPMTQDSSAIAQGQTPSNVIISAVLGSQRSISTFASFTRDISSIASRLESQTTNTTLLAPLNSAMAALPRKPWEDPNDYAQLGEQAYLGDGGAKRAQQNLERFVNAHVVPISPWREGEKIQTLAGREVWWETRDGKMLILPDQVEVEKVAKTVGNGEIWIVKGVVNYAG